MTALVVVADFVVVDFLEVVVRVVVRVERVVVCANAMVANSEAVSMESFMLNLSQCRMEFEFCKTWRSRHNG